MKDFDKVNRYWPDERFCRFENDPSFMLLEDDGGWIEYQAYDDLLQAYKELKWRMEQLEK